MGDKSPGWGVRILVFSIILAGCACLEAWAQGSDTYQRAKTPLRAAPVGVVRVRSLPSPEAPFVAGPGAKAEVVVIGRQGSWYEVQYEVSGRVTRGWLPITDVKILGPAVSQPRSAAQVKQVSASPSSKPWYVIPHLAYAYGAKDFPNQIRVGADIVRRIRPGVDLGGTAELGFLEQVLVILGPTAMYSWGSMGTFPIHPGIFAGLPVYIVSNDNDTDVLFGPRFGLDFAYAIQSNIELSLRAGADVLLIGSERVAVPVMGGLALRIPF